MKTLIIIAIIILILIIVATIFAFRFLFKTIKKGLRFANSTLDKEHKFKMHRKKSSQNSSYSNELSSLFNNVKKYVGIFNENEANKLHERIENQEIIVENKLEEFKIILDRKLNKEELTYARFLDSVTKVHVNILDTLDIVKHKYQILENMDIEGINKRLQQLAKKNSYRQNNEFEAIQRRKDMIENELTQIDKLLACNEDALTSIDNMKLKLVNLNVAREAKELEDSINQLNKVAMRVKNYE